MAAPNRGHPARAYHARMASGERAFVSWLASRYARKTDLRRGGVELGIGDDMAILRTGIAGRRGRSNGRILIAADMLMEGVDFDLARHTPQQIGRKALAVNLSDCAAMAVRPRWAVVSLALPKKWPAPKAKGLYLGMEPLAEKYDCRIVGGDTNSWEHGLVIDVTVIAEPWPGIEPVCRDGMRPGDAICVTGALGGSIAGHHLTFEPRVKEACALATRLGRDLHAMMDLSDGLSIDATRMVEASGCGIELDEAALLRMASEAAKSARGPRSVLSHVLHDGEDFELLYSCKTASAHGGAPIGRAIEKKGLWLVADGRREKIKPLGWQHAMG